MFFDDNAKFAFFSSVIAMMIAHGFCFLNVMYTHDSLYFYEKSGVGKVGLGRWLYPFFVHRRGVAGPWLMGIFSILYVSLAVILVVKLLNLSKEQSFCVAIVFTTNITLTSLFCTYIFDADADCFALLAACLAAYSFDRFPRGLRIICSVVCLITCLALYQAYICVTVGLYLIIIIRRSGYSKVWKDIYDTFMSGLLEIGTLFFATLIYIPLMKAAADHHNVEISNGYNGAGKLQSLTLQDVLDAIPEAYEYFNKTFFDITEYNSKLISSINLLILMILLVALIIYIYDCKAFKGSLVLIIPCIALMPLGLNVIYLVSMGTIHQLMIFAFNIALLLPFVLLNMTKENNNTNLKEMLNVLNILMVVFILVIGFHNVVYDNGAYVHKKLVYDNTLLHAQTIWEDVNSLEGYVEGDTKVVFMGSFMDSKAAYNSSVGERYVGVLTGGGRTAISSGSRAGAFYYSILGRNMRITFNEKEVAENEEFKKMPVYPRTGYCRMLGDTVVVKMHE